MSGTGRPFWHGLGGLAAAQAPHVEIEVMVQQLPVRSPVVKLHVEARADAARGDGAQFSGSVRIEWPAGLTGAAAETSGGDVQPDESFRATAVRTAAAARRQAGDPQHAPDRKS